MAKLCKITKKYGNRSIFDSFDLEFADGKITALLGASGIGKTTLLNIMAGLTDYDGSVEVPMPVSYVFQSDRLIKHLTVRENLEFVLSDKDNKALRADITRLLKKVGLKDKADSYPDQLSGGEKQRVSIARAFIYPSETLLLDEPFSSLDYSLKVQLMNLLTDLLKESNKTAVFVTHNVEECLAIADDIFVLGHNRILYRKNMPCGDKPRKPDEEYVNAVRGEIYEVLTTEHD